LELSQELREVIKHKNLPTKIILMTADEEVNHSELIRTGLIDAFLQKPFYEEDVIGKFKEVTRDTLDHEDD
jgi:FixJ family two-component response regulator